MVLKLYYASKSVTNGRTDGWTEGRTDGRTNNPEAICPSNFFEVGGIIMYTGNPCKPQFYYIKVGFKGVKII